MNALREIEIHIEGKVGAQSLTPALVDIEEIRELLSEAAALLFPTEKTLPAPRHQLRNQRRLGAAPF